MTGFLAFANWLAWSLLAVLWGVLIYGCRGIEKFAP